MVSEIGWPECASGPSISFGPSTGRTQSEAPLAFDHLARPFVMKLLTAEAMPERSADFTRYAFRIQRSILFADDPFKGVPRELTATDHVYAIERHCDPRWKSPNLYLQSPQPCAACFWRIASPMSRYRPTSSEFTARAAKTLGPPTGIEVRSAILIAAGDPGFGSWRLPPKLPPPWLLASLAVAG